MSIPVVDLLPNLDRLRVLLVEDNPGDVLLIGSGLGEAGLETVRASRLDQALEVLAREAIDAVLLDLGLPDSQGIATLGSVLAVTHQPIIVLTGLDDETVGLEAVRLGAEDFLVKGKVDDSALARAVRFGVERSRLRAAVAAPLLESAPVGLAVLDTGLRFVYANPAIASITGVGAALHLGRAIGDLIPELGDARTGLISDLLRGQAVRDVEVTIASGGRWLTLVVSGEPMRDTRGAVVGATVTMADITERKRREEAVASLAESRSQAQAIGESIPFGIWIAGPDGGMDYLSRSFLQLIGMKMEAAAGHGWLAAVSPADRDRVEAVWAHSIATGGRLEIEYGVIAADGSLHTILARGYPVADVGSTTTSWAGINLDITERKEDDRFRDALVGVLSHELRTPVTSIYGAIRVLLRSELTGETRQELLLDIEAESERLRRLIDDLLILAKAEQAGDADAGQEPVLLQHLAPRVAADVQRRWPSVTIEVDVAPDVPVAIGDEARVEQALHNLLTNAAKYAGDAGTIMLSLTSEDDWATVRVIDGGPGIEPGEADRLFDLFYRSRGVSRTTSGSGIGLFVVRRLVQSMGGEVWACPRRDGQRGAEFGFRLPAMASSDT